MLACDRKLKTLIYASGMLQFGRVLAASLSDRWVPSDRSVRHLYEQIVCNMDELFSN